ncbi:15-cis-phytoene synthase [Heliomarina baculiformis]|uniref:15-cis-phytoene synthase n=1 Tax=Heliomarina baculiformis TaxID=2872036 RepID=UPI001EE181C8|nr:phytoene/squalene synthase family protein [Heliomarina baculiformis]
MINPSDIDHCREAIRHGSRSFHAASSLLPARVRDPVLALYAFCRLADDQVDLQLEKSAAVQSLRERLEFVYEGRPRNLAADRAFAAIVEDYAMPRALPEALLEGLSWDAMGRRYTTLSELSGYAARVAASVGAMMCVLMQVRDRDALARACDLGVAMQLTNIARDVGEDARENRLYLPLDWLHELDIDPETFLFDPHPNDRTTPLVRRLLDHADTLYARSEAGISTLPFDCRAGIFSARYIYAGIGGRIRANGYDTITRRARTGIAQKIGWLGLSAARSLASVATPQSSILYAKPLPETAFLVDAAAEASVKTDSWSDTLCTAFTQLAHADNSRKNAFVESAARFK